MNTGLILGLAAEIGAPMIERILAGKIGRDNAALTREVITRIAMRSGARVEELDALAESDPETVREAIVDVETQSPEILALYAQEVDLRMAQLEASRTEPRWWHAWRPVWMYLLGFLWLWNLVILHLLNARFKTALPPTDLLVLLQLTGIFLGLYMGGHTVKDFVAKWAAKGGAR